MRALQLLQGLWSFSGRTAFRELGALSPQWPDLGDSCLTTVAGRANGLRGQSVPTHVH